MESHVLYMYMCMYLHCTLCIHLSTYCTCCMYNVRMCMVCGSGQVVPVCSVYVVTKRVHGEHIPVHEYVHTYICKCSVCV